MARHFDDKKYWEWEKNNHIPEDVMKMVEAVGEQIGVYVEETTVEYKNRGGWTYAFAKGFILTHCTSSLADGPSEDMAPVFMKWLGGLGFEVCREYGDNGLDSATNWHDTFWNVEIAYRPSMIEYSVFEWYDDDDDDCDYEDEEDYW